MFHIFRKAHLFNNINYYYFLSFSLIHRVITYENLIRYDRDRTTIIGNLAKDFEVSSDGKVFTFNLREGLRWSNGAPFSADDLAFWYNDVVMNADLSPTESWPHGVGGARLSNIGGIDSPEEG